MKYTEKKFYYVEYHDLEQKIEEVYGHYYEIPPNEECGNDVSLEFNVDSTGVTGWELDKLNDFKAGLEPQWALSYILKDLASNGHIPAGNWIVRVSW